MGFPQRLATHGRIEHGSEPRRALARTTFMDSWLWRLCRLHRLFLLSNLASQGGAHADPDLASLRRSVCWLPAHRCGPSRDSGARVETLALFIEWAPALAHSLPGRIAKPWGQAFSNAPWPVPVYLTTYVLTFRFMPIFRFPIRLKQNSLPRSRLRQLARLPAGQLPTLTPTHSARKLRTGSRLHAGDAIDPRTTGPDSTIDARFSRPFSSTRLPTSSTTCIRQPE